MLLLLLLLKFSGATEYQEKKTLKLKLTALRSFNCTPLFTGFYIVTYR
jgi:hypothetical protein